MGYIGEKLSLDLVIFKSFSDKLHVFINLVLQFFIALTLRYISDHTHHSIFTPVGHH